MAVYKQKSSDSWYIDYYIPGGRRIREVAGSSKKLAQQLLAKRKAEILEGKYQVNRPDPIYFREFAREFLDYCEATKKRSTLRFHRNSLNRLGEEFNEVFLGDITPYMIEQYKIKRSGQVSPSSVNRELATLSHLFKLALE